MWRARRPLVLVSYLCYTVALFVLFTYLTFPSQQVRAFVLTTLNHHGLGQIRIGSIRPFFPAGLTFREVSITHDVDGHSLELMRMPELQVHLRTLYPFANPIRIGFEGEVYGGMFLGAVEWEHNGTGPVLDIHIELQDIRPAIHPLTTKLGNAIVAGKLAGTIALQLSNGHWQDGNGRLMLHGEAGNIAGLTIGSIQLPALTYDRLTVELVLQQRQVEVKDVQMSGRDWQVTVQGSVSLDERLRQSPVDLTLRVHTSETFEQQLGLAGILLKQRRDRLGSSTLKINGTLEHLNPVL
jgi:type II secretion system protein N